MSARSAPLSGSSAIPPTVSRLFKTIVATTESTAAIAEQTLKLFFEPERKVLPRQEEIDVRGLAQSIAFLGEAGTLKEPLPPAERFVDLQYLRAAGIQ
jgi:hypothetical protein